MTQALQSYITDNLNDGHLEYFYFTCIALCVALAPVNVRCFALFEEVDEREIEALLYVSECGDARTAQAGTGSQRGSQRRSSGGGPGSGPGGGPGGGQVGSLVSSPLLDGGEDGGARAGSVPSKEAPEGGGWADGEAGRRLLSHEAGAGGRRRSSGARSGGRRSSLIGDARGSGGRYSFGGIGSVIMD